METSREQLLAGLGLLIATGAAVGMVCQAGYWLGKWVWRKGVQGD